MRQLTPGVVGLQHSTKEVDDTVGGNREPQRVAWRRGKADGGRAEEGPVACCRVEAPEIIVEGVWEVRGGHKVNLN